MSTIELVDPELRDALALWPVEPLTTDTLTQRRGNLLKVIGAVPKPDLPDITADEIRVESAFGAKPIPFPHLSPGQVQRSNCPLSCTFMAAASWRAHPNNSEGCAARVGFEMRDLFGQLSPSARGTAPRAAGGHLLGVRLAARELQGSSGLILPVLGIKGESGAAVWLRPLRYTLATTRGQSSPFNT